MKLLSKALAASLAMMIGASFAGEPSQADLAKQAKISRAEAEKTALTKVHGGIVQSAELEHEHNHLVWSFDIAQPGTRNIREILVDAKSGKIISSETENPKAQAKEAAAESKESAKP